MQSRSKLLCYAVPASRLTWNSAITITSSNTASPSHEMAASDATSSLVTAPPSARHRYPTRSQVQDSTVSNMRSSFERTSSSNTASSLKATTPSMGHRYPTQRQVAALRVLPQDTLLNATSNFNTTSTSTVNIDTNLAPRSPEVQLTAPILNEQPCLFLTLLPLEIRFMIYKYNIEGGEFCNRGTSHVSALHNYVIGGRRSSDRTWRQPIHSSFGMLLVCIQMRSEVQQILGNYTTAFFTNASPNVWERIDTRQVDWSNQQIFQKPIFFEQKAVQRLAFDVCFTRRIHASSRTLSSRHTSKFDIETIRKHFPMLRHLTLSVDRFCIFSREGTRNDVCSTSLITKWTACKHNLVASEDLVYMVVAELESRIDKTKTKTKTNQQRSVNVTRAWTTDNITGQHWKDIVLQYRRGFSFYFRGEHLDHVDGVSATHDERCDQTDLSTGFYLELQTSIYWIRDALYCVEDVKLANHRRRTWSDGEGTDGSCGMVRLPAFEESQRTSRTPLSLQDR